MNVRCGLRLPAGGPHLFRYCPNEAVTLRYARVGDGLVASVPVCAPHEEWWDLAAADHREQTVEVDG